MLDIEVSSRFINAIFALEVTAYNSDDNWSVKFSDQAGQAVGTTHRCALATHVHCFTAASFLSAPITLLPSAFQMQHHTRDPNNAIVSRRPINIT